MKNSTKNMINKYSKAVCIAAYKEHLSGKGGRTIGNELGLKTATADALINAGRELAEE